MFETRTEIRRQAREEGRQEGEKLGLERGEKDALERIRLNMQKQGLQLSPEQEAAIFGNRNRHQR